MQLKSNLLRHPSPALPPAQMRELLRAAGGASAILIYAVPNSPLAQPWLAICGNVISAVAAIAVLRTVPMPWAPALAVAAAIFALMIPRALHPPGGAIALLACLLDLSRPH